MTTFDLDRYASLRDDTLLRWYELNPRYNIYTAIYRILPDILRDIYGFTIDYVTSLPPDWYACTVHDWRRIFILDDQPYQRLLRSQCKYNPDLEPHRTQSGFHETTHVALPEHWIFAKGLHSYHTHYPNALPNLARDIQDPHLKIIEDEAHVCGQVWAVPEWQLVLRPEYDLIKQCIEGRARLHSWTFYHDVIKSLSRHFGITPTNLCYVLRRYGLVRDFWWRVNHYIVELPSALPGWTRVVEDNPAPIPLGLCRPPLVSSHSSPTTRRDWWRGRGGVLIPHPIH